MLQGPEQLSRLDKLREECCEYLRFSLGERGQRGQFSPTRRGQTISGSDVLGSHHTSGSWQCAEPIMQVRVIELTQSTKYIPLHAELKSSSTDADGGLLSKMRPASVTGLAWMPVFRGALRASPSVPSFSWQMHSNG